MFMQKMFFLDFKIVGLVALNDVMTGRWGYSFKPMSTRVAEYHTSNMTLDGATFSFLSSLCTTFVVVEEDPCPFV